MSLSHIVRNAISIRNAHVDKTQNKENAKSNQMFHFVIVYRIYKLDSVVGD